MSFPRYPKYKDGGVDWLGEVPEHWQVTRIDCVASLNDEELGEDTDPTVPIRYVDISSLNPESGKLSPEGMTFGSAPSRARRVVRTGDVIVSTVRTYLRAIAPIRLQDEGLIVSTGFAVVRPRCGLAVEFARYALLASTFIDEVISRSTGVSYPAINARELGWIKIPMPVEDDEQIAIAVFLDQETAKIDALIEEQRRLIELLKEKRQAVISHAVTKGLNSVVPMQEVCIDWVGTIPAHWSVYPIKRLFRLVCDPAPKNNDEELLSIYTDIGVRPRKSLEERGNKASTTDGYWRVRRGDFIVNKLLAWMGAIGLSHYDGVTSPAYDILRRTRKLDERFFESLFRCGIMFSEFRRFSRGIMDMRLRLYFEELGQIAVPFPPPDEQTAIANFIEEESNRIEALEQACRNNVALLQERRSALISAAVTGKIDVRHYAPQETPADAEEMYEPA